MSKKLTKEQQLYIDKQLEFAEKLYDKVDEELQEPYKQQKSNRDDILNEIAKIMLSYTITDSTLSIGSIEKQKLKEKLSKFIRDKIQNELIDETNLTDKLLKSTGKEKYNINNYLHDIGMNTSWDIKPVDDVTLNNVINTKVDNKLWSDRLWDNKNDLQKDLQLEINNFLDGKTSVNEIEAKIKKKCNSNAYNTKRLVQDNVARVQESINDVWREDHNVKYVLYMATLCGNTCADCRQYDGKDYPIHKKPISLPQHCFCRCTYVNIPNSDWRPKMRLDNETKEKINWQSYEEWMINYNNGLDNDNKLLNIPEKTLKHVYEGDFTNPKNPKKIKPGEIRLKSGGHSQKSIELLIDKKIEYNIVKEYANGVRVGNVPNHKLNAKQTGTGQAWFPENWTDKDIQKAAEYVANLKDKKKYILQHNKFNENVISIFKFANYNNVTVGVCYDCTLKKITTIFPDESQRMLGSE
ncbi:EndoU domain-containing protein [Clostridium weizhouense]|uniref:EndoU domain-containing protein n=1 Tax=Clostridium weizhouense TaxID=2859781 RepID=A0ABS7AK17_9CLOT|nr:EndoU domain-containing protein [Clostridium weizhouense]MBW6408982.1 EndoU domain-containing protein [Clostridium weizhouense]